MRLLIQRPGEVFCILDALDECEEEGRDQIITALSTLYQQARSRRTGSSLRFLVTSRPYQDIERRFNDLISNFPTIRLQGEQESDTISREIDIVIRWRVSKLGSELKLNESEKFNLETELLGMTNRTYLWLTLILDIIRKTIRPTSRKLKAIINTLPSTIDQAYETILSKIEEHERPQAQKLLQIIVAATRPLTLKEMNIALAIEDHHRSYDDLDLDDEARLEASLRNICGLFVTVVDQKVYLIYQTAKEFLLVKNEATAGKWKHYLIPIEAETLMAKICVVYLSSTEFDEAVDHRSATAKYDYLEHVAGFWAAHYRNAQNSATEKMLQLVLQLCDTRSQRFRTWFNIYWRTTASWQDRVSPQLTSSLMVGSFFGHEAVVRLLLATGQAEVNSEDWGGRTSLHWASSNGHESVTKLLLATGKFDVNLGDLPFGMPPLMWASHNGHESVVKLLLETGEVDIDRRDSEYNGTTLSWAARRGHEAVVKLLLATGQANIDSKDVDGQTPLSLAAKNGHNAVAKLLLTTGETDVNATDKYFDRTPLLWAVSNGDEAVVKLLLATGKVDVDLKDNKGRTLLSMAAINGYGAVVKLLLAIGQADIDAKDNSGRTPLLWAARNGHEDVVKQLLATGQVDVDSKDGRDRTPLSWAVENGHEAVVKLLQSFKHQ